LGLGAGSASDWGNGGVTTAAQGVGEFSPAAPLDPACFRLSAVFQGTLLAAVGPGIVAAKRQNAFSALIC
jgi:hypothetical protein